jgi:lipid-binding SYLF domain-containing protein
MTGADDRSTSFRVECSEHPSNVRTLEDEKRWRTQEDELMPQEVLARARATLLLRRIKALRGPSDYFAGD